MNLNHLSDKELIQYADKHTEDPLVRRLVDILMARTEGLVTELIEAGMHSVEWTFEYDHMVYSPKDYIEHLLKQISYTEDDLWVAQGELRDCLDELKKLEARTILEVIADLKKTIDRVDSDIILARQERDQAIINERRTRDKMKVWTAISTDMSK